MYSFRTMNLSATIRGARNRAAKHTRIMVPFLAENHPATALRGIQLHEFLGGHRQHRRPPEFAAAADRQPVLSCVAAGSIGNEYIQF